MTTENHTTVTVTLHVQVTNPALLHAAALKHAVEVDGLYHDEAQELLEDDDGHVNVSACLLMLLDPGSLCAGAEIVEGGAEAIPF